MKKLVLITATVLLSISAYSQKNIDELISKFEKVSNVESVEIGPAGLAFAKNIVSNSVDIPLEGKLGSLNILNLSKCTDNDKKKFVESVKNLHKNNYETLLRIKDKGKNIYILARKKGNSINEFAILTNDDPMIIRLKGSFNESDFKNIASK